jgi:hypothetical protein
MFLDSHLHGPHQLVYASKNISLFSFLAFNLISSKEKFSNEIEVFCAVVKNVNKRNKRFKSGFFMG